MVTFWEMPCFNLHWVRLSWLRVFVYVLSPGKFGDSTSIRPWLFHSQSFQFVSHESSCQSVLCDLSYHPRHKINHKTVKQFSYTLLVQKLLTRECSSNYSFRPCEDLSTCLGFDLQGSASMSKAISWRCKSSGMLHMLTQCNIPEYLNVESEPSEMECCCCWRICWSCVCVLLVLHIRIAMIWSFYRDCIKFL